MKNKLKLGKTYFFAGARCIPVELNEDNEAVIIQFLGVSHGAWPGYVMPQYGNGFFFNKDINFNISKYDKSVSTLYNKIKNSDLIGMLCMPTVRATKNHIWKEALVNAAGYCEPFGSPIGKVWLGNANGNDCAWCISSDGDVNGFYGQDNDFIIAPYLVLDLTCIKVDGDEIVVNSVVSVKEGDLVICKGEKSENLSEHELYITSVKTDSGYVTMGNPDGIVCYGVDLTTNDPENTIKCVTETNFVRLVKNDEMQIPRSLTAIERDGFKLRINTVLFSVDQWVDIKVALGYAAREFASTSRGEKVLESTCDCFNLVDFELNVSNDFCRKYGFEIEKSFESEEIDWDTDLRYLA